MITEIYSNSRIPDKLGSKFLNLNKTNKKLFVKGKV